MDAKPVMDDPIPRYAQLDVWLALGGDGQAFERWRDERGFADAWAQLMAAVKGDVVGLLADTNPPAGALLDLVRLPTNGDE